MFQKTFLGNIEVDLIAQSLWSGLETNLIDIVIGHQVIGHR
jgi:hypothetical protein